MAELGKTEKKFLIIGGVVIFVLIIFILILVGLNKNKGKASNYLSLENKVSSGKISVESGKFSDSTCGISFEVPAGMSQSSTTLPLPQEALSQAVFDETANKSVLSYICYDGKYTFDELNESSGNSEQVTVGNKTFSRKGNFVYFNTGDKLIIFQMFFTKNDLNPKSGYEEKLQKLLGSVS